MIQIERRRPPKSVNMKVDYAFLKYCDDLAAELKRLGLSNKKTSYRAITAYISSKKPK